jgi:hypothetical protein
VGERGSGSKGARACRGGRRTRGRGHVHGGGRGREVRDGLTGGGCGAERESERVRKEAAPTGRPHRAARGGEGEKRCTGWRQQAGSAS